MEKLLKSVLARITPDEKEKSAVMGKVTLIETIARRLLPKGTKMMLVGSLAKDTWLKGSTDIDMFFLFEPDFDLESAMPLLHKIADELHGEKELLYAQHPYIHVHFDGYEADLVPAYDVPSTDIKSAVDRTPYHVEFVKENLVTTDEVLLLKQFAKGVGVYGADMVHEGFSGYLCELLVIKYGSFAETLKSAEKWSVPMKLEDVDMEGALVMSDPVDPNRNVAAAVSEETLKKFIRAAKEFLKEPSEKFFFRAETPEVGFGKMDNLFVVELEHDKATEDIVASQERCLMLGVVEKLNEYGFRVERYERFPGAFALLMHAIEVPAEYVHNGPPLTLKENAEKFREKWPKAYEEDGRLKVKAKRQFTKAKDYLTHLLKDLPNHIRSAKIAEPEGKLKKEVGVFVRDIPSWRF